MTLESYIRRWSQLHGGYVPKRRSIVGAYLRFMYIVARPFVRAGFHPDVVTLLALGLVVLAPLAAQAHLLWVASLTIAITGIFDGIDGAVAVIRDKVSRWGSVLDSVADRIAEGVYVLTLMIVGAPVHILMVGWAVTMLQEYVRAKAGALGATDIGVVSVWERPTRIALASLTLLGFGIVSAAWVLSASAWVWLALSALGLIQVSVAMRRQLA